MENSKSPELVVISSPIGNLQDLTIRAKNYLESADLWIVEDTRVSSKLQKHLNVSTKMKVLNNHTPTNKLSSYIQEIEQHQSTVLLSDAGTPGISDPGAELINLAYENNINILGLPGPSAVTLALSISGFFAQRFAFLGFPPRKNGPIASLLLPYAESTTTLTFFESPFRVKPFLKSAFQTLGNRRAVICRELTKLHEEIIRCNLDDVERIDKIPEKGEFTIVIEGFRRP